MIPPERQRDYFTNSLWSQFVGSNSLSYLFLINLADGQRRETMPTVSFLYFPGAHTKFQMGEDYLKFLGKLGFTDFNI